MKLAYRLFMAAVMVFVVSTLTFFLIRLMPGNPIENLIVSFEQQGMTAQQGKSVV